MAAVPTPCGSGKNYRWANPSRLSGDELPDLLDVDIAVVRILGGHRAWHSGIDTVIASGVPTVLVSGELTDRSTVPAGTALQAHIYLAHGGVDNLRQLPGRSAAPDGQRDLPAPDSVEQLASKARAAAS